MGRIEEELEEIKGGWICPQWMTCMCEILKQLKSTYRILRNLPPGCNVTLEEITVQCQHAGGSGLYAQYHRKLGVVSQTCSSSKGWRQEV